MHEIFKRLSQANHSFGHRGHAIPTTGCWTRVFLLPPPTDALLPPSHFLSLPTARPCSLLAAEPRTAGGAQGRWWRGAAVSSKRRRPGGGERVAAIGSGKGCARRRAALRLSPRSVPSHSLFPAPVGSGVIFRIMFCN